MNLTPGLLENFISMRSTVRNAAAFVNHRCKNFNLEPRKILSHQGHTRIVFAAIRRIKAGEVLTINYWKGKIGSNRVRRNNLIVVCAMSVLRKRCA